MKWSNAGAVWGLKMHSSQKTSARKSSSSKWLGKSSTDELTCIFSKPAHTHMPGRGHGKEMLLYIYQWTKNNCWLKKKKKKKKNAQ